MNLFFFPIELNTIQGDVQTAGTMAVIAPEQLKISLRRRLHIYDAYIGKFFLTLHVSFCSDGFVRSTTEVPALHDRSVFPQTL